MFGYRLNLATFALRVILSRAPTSDIRRGIEGNTLDTPGVEEVRIPTGEFNVMVWIVKKENAGQKPRSPYE
jgi:hypothetical protein